MSGVVKANVAVDEIRKVIHEFEKSAKTGRAFFPEDAAFDFKCSSYLKTLARMPFAEASDDGVSVTDKSTYPERPNPATCTITKSDVLAVLDNTKAGFLGFGNILKKECQAGMLVTTKGIVVINIFDNKPKMSGFLEWLTVANCSPFGCDNGNFAVDIFASWSGTTANGPYAQKGPLLMFYFQHAPTKKISRHLDKMMNHLKFIVKGCEGKFNNLEYIAEYGTESDD